MRKLVLLFLLLIFKLTITAEVKKASQVPEIGKPCPEFSLNNIQYYHKKQASLAELRGKWIVLDFWSEYCSGCIASFPKMNLLKQKYGEKVQFFLIGLPYKNQQTIEALYERCRKSKDLNIPLVFDKTLGEKFNANRLPLIIVIDPNGIIRSITYTLGSADIEEFLTGKNPALPRNFLLHENPNKDYSFDKPLLMNGNGGSEKDIIYRSILVKWKETLPRYNIIFSKGRFEAFEVDVATLYKLAYIGKDVWSIEDSLLFGRYFPEPILEIRDSSLFKSSRASDRNRFCYSLDYPDSILTDADISFLDFSENKRIQKIMQRDLENYFGYYGKIEDRKVPIYKLVASSEAKLNATTKGGQSIAQQPNGPKQGVLLKNLPIQALISAIYMSIGSPQKIPIIDNTGIDRNIDIKIEGVYFDDYLKDLRKQGFDLVADFATLKVLVIRQD